MAVAVAVVAWKREGRKRSRGKRDGAIRFTANTLLHYAQLGR